jgi:hypothetical protein
VREILTQLQEDQISFGDRSAQSLTLFFCLLQSVFERVLFLLQFLQLYPEERLTLSLFSISRLSRTSFSMMLSLYASMNASGLVAGVSSGDGIGLCVPASVLPGSEASALSPDSISVSVGFTSPWPVLSMSGFPVDLSDVV